MQKLMARKTVRKRYVRYSLLSLNVLLLGGVILFVFQGTHGSQARHSSAGALTVGSDEAADPLDQLSSADIAVSLARMTDIAEAGEVVNQAISVNTELTATPIDKAVVNKPQAVLTALKSRKDIQSYVVQAGDTVQVVAAKFNVTSDSIKWSNGLSGNTLAVGQKLTIPPVTGIVYTVRAGDTPDTLAQRYRADKNQIVAYNDAEISGLRVGEQIIIPNGQQVSSGGGNFDSGLSFLGGVPSYGSNGYYRGFCTWYAANRRAQLGNPVPGNLGDAYTWARRASSFGIPTGSVPKPGAVAMKHAGAPGHVAIVEVVNEDGSFWISEMNSSGQRSMTDSRPAGGWGVVDWKLIPASGIGTYTYIY